LETHVKIHHSLPRHIVHIDLHKLIAHDILLDRVNIVPYSFCGEGGICGVWTAVCRSSERL
jgi:hypothetical protein